MALPGERTNFKYEPMRTALEGSDMLKQLMNIFSMIQQGQYAGARPSLRRPNYPGIETGGGRVGNYPGIVGGVSRGPGNLESGVSPGQFRSPDVGINPPPGTPEQFRPPDVRVPPGVKPPPDIRLPYFPPEQYRPLPPDARTPSLPPEQFRPPDVGIKPPPTYKDRRRFGPKPQFRSGPGSVVGFY